MPSLPFTLRLRSDYLFAFLSKSKTALGARNEPIAIDDRA
jgi:hypothetical protein